LTTFDHTTIYTSYSLFSFNDTATTEIYTLSLHDALPIYLDEDGYIVNADGYFLLNTNGGRIQISDNVESFSIAKNGDVNIVPARSEEHTSELQSRENLVCRLLLEKKKKKKQ